MVSNFHALKEIKKRDFLFIDDLTRALFLAMSKKKSRGHIFNIGTGRPVKVKYIIKKIQKNNWYRTSKIWQNKIKTRGKFFNISKY